MQSNPKSFKVTLFFPLRDNDGNAFEEETWDWWRDEMQKLLRGFTDLGVVRGWWNGKSDRNRWIVIIVGTEKEVNRIREFLKLARRKFRQDTMYLDFHPVHFEEVE